MNGRKVLVLEYRRDDVQAISEELRQHGYNVFVMRDFPLLEEGADIPVADVVLAGDVFRYARAYFNGLGVPAAFFSSFMDGRMYFADITLNPPSLPPLKWYRPSEAAGVMLGEAA